MTGKALDAVAPNLTDIRDEIEHADRRVQLRDEMVGLVVEFADERDFHGELTLRVAGYDMRLKEAARAALDLARVIDEHIFAALQG